jgi:hypothetical protein
VIDTHTHAHAHSHTHARALCNSQRYTQLEVESSVHPSKRMYCPHKDCFTLLMRPSKKSLAVQTTCPECERTFCSKCLIPGWHEVRALFEDCVW